MLTWRRASVAFVLHLFRRNRGQLRFINMNRTIVMKRRMYTSGKGRRGVADGEWAIYRSSMVALLSTLKLHSGWLETGGKKMKCRRGSAEGRAAATSASGFSVILRRERRERDEGGRPSGISVIAGRSVAIKDQGGPSARTIYWVVVVTLSQLLIDRQKRRPRRSRAWSASMISWY